MDKITFESHAGQSGQIRKTKRKMNSLLERKIGIIGSFVIALCLTSCGQRPTMPTSDNYPTMKVTQKDIVLYEAYTASIQGKQNVEIRPQVSGQIVKVCINEGASIQKGQTLFIIDQVPYEAALKTAKANVESAKAKLATAQLMADSKRELYRQQIVSDFDLQTAQNTLLEAQATLEQAQAAEVNARNDLSYTVIRSPVDGVAGMIPYKVGALVSSSIATPLTTVSNSDEMHAYFSLTETQTLEMIQIYGSLKDMVQSLPEVKLRLNNGAEYAETGKIDAISGTVDASTGAVGIRATFPNPNGLLMNGGTATVIIPHERKHAIVIPQTATFEIQNKHFVYKISDGKAQSVPVQIFEIHNGLDFVVEKGLSSGDIIISEGAGLVREGTTVNVKS